jgi:anti-anti-sigma factor
VPISFGVHVVAVDPVHCLLAAQGELDLATSPQLSQTLRHQLVAGRRFADLNLASLTFCDASGLGSMIEARRGFVAAGGSLRLIDCSAKVMRLLTITGLTDLLPAPEIKTRSPEDAREAGTSELSSVGRATPCPEHDPSRGPARL